MWFSRFTNTLDESGLHVWDTRRSCWRISPSSPADQMRCGLSGAVASRLTRAQWHTHSSSGELERMLRARTVPSAAHVASMSGDRNFTEKMFPVCPVDMFISSLYRKGSHSITWRSSDADANIDPSWFHSRQFTHPICPWSSFSRPNLSIIGRVTVSRVWNFRSRSPRSLAATMPTVPVAQAGSSLLPISAK
ncbi:unnamed protein product [Chrysodeixis includens]|uniref:Uncharacterized protein n=1 Tax=Chrysodeixis includens TaxID=689277 RepID=A0A9N8KTU6_CHRIL|nr:unnamed protein product [Chrysodeixis includens]